MYKRILTTTTMMFLMLGVLWAGAAQDAQVTNAEKEAYYEAINAEKEAYYDAKEAEKEAYYEAINAEKEAYYDAKEAEKEAYYDALNAQIDAEKEAYYNVRDVEKRTYYEAHGMEIEPQLEYVLEVNEDALQLDGSSRSSYVFTLTTASFGSEISWAITAAGDTSDIYVGSGYSSNSTYTDTLDLADGDYEFHLYDSYGDGWNGATYSIDDLAGHNIVSGGLTSGSYGMDPFSVPWEAPTIPYYFSLTTASWASEISWTVTAAGDSTVLYSGSGYGQ